MFHKQRQEYKREIKSSGGSSSCGTTLGTVTCYQDGVALSVTVYRVSQNIVTASVSYDKSEVSWVDRDSFESRAERGIMEALNDKGYGVSTVRFYKN